MLKCQQMLDFWTKKIKMFRKNKNFWYPQERLVTLLSVYSVNNSYWSQCSTHIWNWTKTRKCWKCELAQKNNDVFPYRYQKKLVQIVVIVLNSTHYSFSWTLNNLRKNLHWLTRCSIGPWNCTHAHACFAIDWTHVLAFQWTACACVSRPSLAPF